jgi:kynureninase
VRAWAEGWWRLPLEAGDRIAGLIGAAPGSVAMYPNVSLAQALVLSCFDLAGRRNKIVYDELNFPSVMYVYQSHRSLGARIHVVPSEDGISVPLPRLLDAIDEETLLVPISHVVFKSGFIQDVAAITRRAHEVGALVVADLYQSVGSVPVDVTAWDVDFAVGGSVKWLCGGPGAGYLYVAPRLQQSLEPRLTGWAAHSRPFAFETEHCYAGNVARFLHGTPAVPALYAARPGAEIVAAAGVPAIRAKSQRQLALLLDLAQERGFAPRVPDRPEQRGGFAILDVPHGEAVTRELLRRQVLVDYRPNAGIRLSPHFYTSDDEIRHALDEARLVLDSGAWRGQGSGSVGF